MLSSSLNENAQKWVRALRSGIYRQGKGYLGQKVWAEVDSPKDQSFETVYCCLGVACELAKLDGVNISRIETDADSIAYDGSTGLLPQSVMDWLGLNNDDGAFNRVIEHEDGRFTNLAELNDSANYSFEEIADVVESNPAGLFRQQ